MERALDVHSHDEHPIFRVRPNARKDRSRRPQVFAWLRHAAHFFSSTHSTRDRVAPEGHDRDPRASMRLYRFSAQSRMTIASPPPTQPSCAARSSSSQVRSGDEMRPISAHTSYAASNLGHVIGGQRFFVSLAIVVEQQRSCRSDRFFPCNPPLSLFGLRKGESLRPLPTIPPLSASLKRDARARSPQWSSSHLSHFYELLDLLPPPRRPLHALPVSYPL